MVYCYSQELRFLGLAKYILFVISKGLIIHKNVKIGDKKEQYCRHYTIIKFNMIKIN